MTDPVMTRATLDRAGERLTQTFDAELDEVSKQLRHAFSHAVARAYQEGLRDGFVQGAAAQAEAEREVTS